MWMVLLASLFMGRTIGLRGVGAVWCRGPKRVFERLKDDFNTKKRERCVRLDTPVMSSTGVLNGPLEGMAELETFIKESVRLSFESRQTAYENEVRRLMATRMEPGWSFPNLFLVKDSLAIMLEAAGLQEDALREYFEVLSPNTLLLPTSLAFARFAIVDLRW
jgi:hypothetical protein